MPLSRVLLIDDEFAITKALSVRLRAAGYEVVSAPNGRSGVSAVHRHRPDAVLLDIRMPDIDGFEVCRLIRSTPEIAATPVIFVSANVQDEARLAARDAGGDAFLSKPVDSAEVIAALRRAIPVSEPATDLGGPSFQRSPS